MDGTRVSGVEFIRDGERLFAESRIETVLASGSIGSPTILQRSGIGDATRLAALGVTPQHALPGVGANLQDHLQLRSIYKVTGIRSINPLAGNWWGQAMLGLEYAWRRGGPLHMVPSQLVVLTKSNPAPAHAHPPKQRTTE